MTIDEVAVKYEVKVGTVKGWIKQGILTARMVAGKLVISQRTLSQFTPPIRGGNSKAKGIAPWREAFLSALRQRSQLPTPAGRGRPRGVVELACQDAGIEKTIAYRLRKQDPEFAAGWDEALGK